MLGLPVESENFVWQKTNMCEKLGRKKKGDLPGKVAGCMRCTGLGAAERDTTFYAPACGLHVARIPDHTGRSLSAWSPVSIS
jgi:hypothetical protein